MSGKAREEATIDRGVLLKGIPFEAKINDIVMFFKSVAIDKDNIHIIRSMDGSATGLAFVRLDDEEELKRALLMDRNHMGSRYIEVRASDESELYYLMLRARAGMTRNELYRISGHGAQKQHPIYSGLDTKFAYIAGVPQGSQYKEIRNFFAGRLIGRGKIWLLREGNSGQFRGDGYIEFANPDECLLGLKNSGKMMHNSVIRVEPCEMEEAEEYSEGNLGSGAGARDVDYRQSRGGYDSGSWDSAGQGRQDREVNNRGSSDRYVSRSHRRTPSPARRRREVYTATYGNNTLRREDLYGEPILDGGAPYDPLAHPNGSSHYASASSQSTNYGGTFGGNGGGISQRQPSDSVSSYRSGVQGIDSYMSSVYGGHATLARQPEKKYSPLFPESLSPAAGSRPLMSLMGGGGGSVGATERRVVRVEGLPYHVTVPQILDFFRGYDVGYDQVRIQCRDDGSPSGKAFVSFPSERHARLASEQLNKRYIGDRYVELFLV